MSRIICAVDLSSSADAAVMQALAMSRRSRSALVVVHALAPNTVSRWHARRRIEVIASLRRSAARDGIPLEVSVHQGDPIEVILQHARVVRPDVIVVGGRRRTDLTGLRRRSLAETLTRRCTSPVLIVPAAPGEAEPGAFRNVVCAIDFSPVSEAAIAQALAMTEDAGRITLLHVVAGISDVSAFKYLFHLRGSEHQEAEICAAQRHLRSYVPRSEACARLHGRVATGDPASEIQRVAQDLDADLLVVGVSRPRLLKGRLFTGTSGRLMRTSRRAVLAVPEGSRTSESVRPQPHRGGVAAAL